MTACIMNMLPALANNCSTDCRLVYPKAFRKSGLCLPISVKLDDFFYVIFRQLGAAIGAPSMVKKAHSFGVGVVAKVGDIFKVASGVVSLVSVFVVDNVLSALTANYAFWSVQKYLGDNGVDRSPGSDIT